MKHLLETARETFDWQACRLDDLSPHRLLYIMRARQQVFVVEQNCAYPDADHADEYSWHLAAWQPGYQLCAYARIVDPGVNYPEASIGRVITAAPVRGRGLGRELLARAIRQAAASYPGIAIKISAQSHLQRFYAGFGFEAVSDIYLEDGIPHIAMCRAADAGLAPAPSASGSARAAPDT